MARVPTTLADVMAILPSLNPQTLASSGVTNLRRLRLVSKEIGQLALNDVVRCTVHVGAGSTYTTPQQLVRLLTEAQLQQLLVVVHVSSGPGAPAPAEQLSRCIDQMECLIAGMGKAIRGVTKLKLDVQHSYVGLVQLKRAESTSSAYRGGDQQHAAQQQQRQQQQQSNQEQLQWQRKMPETEISSTCPKGLGFVAGSAFAMLARTVPHICKLSLDGWCWDAALYSFGLSYAHLVRLEAAAVRVPIEALQDVSMHLPRLRSISVVGWSTRYQESPQYSDFINNLLPLTEHCLHLSSLKLCLQGKIQLFCDPGSWELASARIEHVQCTCDATPSDSFEKLTGRVSSLSLCAIPRDSLGVFLIAFPVLEKFQLIGDKMDGSARFRVQWTDSPLPRENRSASLTRFSLKQRLSTGKFTLKCREIDFIGSGKEIQEMFSWLPIMPDVWDLALKFEGNAEPVCLNEIKRLFPAVRELMLLGEEPEEEPVWGIEVLRPLAEVPSITFLHLCCTQFAFTMPELAQLCGSLCHGVHVLLDAFNEEDSHEFVKEVQKQGFANGVKV